MQTKRIQGITNELYSTEIKFKGFGRMNLTGTEEQELIGNYGLAVEYKNIVFTGKFSAVAGQIIEITDPLGTGDIVTLELNNQIIPLDANFSATFSVKASTIKDALLGTSLTTKDLMAEAMCTLFGNRIEDEITKIIDGAVTKVSNFESEEDKML